MKLAIVGGRDFNDEFIMAEYISIFIVAYTNDELDPPKIEVISGGAKGADTLGERFARINRCPVTIFKPEWNKYGKSAGFIRNQTIVDNCDMVLAFWDGKSRGTADTIEKAKKAKKPTFIVYY
jgi:hypothetical protein